MSASPLPPPLPDEAALDVPALRAEFPALAARPSGRPLAYLDSAATSLKTRRALEAAASIDGRDSGNVHRGVHALSVAASERYEAAREIVARFLGAPGGASEVVFTSGATASLNLVAATHGPLVVGRGDEVVVSVLEHHSNLLPWQRLCSERGARLRAVPLNERLGIDAASVEAALTERTRLVAVAHASNVTGARLPIADIARRVHAVGATLVVDGAQEVAHGPVDVAALGCDFYAFSAHKAYGPTGAGVLWGRAALLEAMPPWQLGGGMVAGVEIESSGYRESPQRFEAGTPPIAPVVGMGEALAWLSSLPARAVEAHEQRLLELAVARLGALAGVRVFHARPGAGGPSAPVLAFAVEGIHPHDLATVLDAEGIAIRAGHHCAQPLMARLGQRALARASFALYNTDEEVERFAAAVAAARAGLRGAR